MGQHAFARRIAPRMRYSAIRVVRQTLVGGAQVELDLSDRIQKETFILRRYAPEVVEAIVSKLSSTSVPVFFDVGANVGLVTFSVGARVRGVKIHAFEPHPDNVATWERNHDLNPDVWATLQPSAVGNRNGLTALQVGSESGWHHISADDTQGEIDVPVTTLDQYAEKSGVDTIDVLKMDIEGYEPFALEGSAKLLGDRRIKCIVTEMNDVHLRRFDTSRGAIVSMLADAGYDARRVPPVGAQRFRRAAPEPPDMLFERRA